MEKNVVLVTCTISKHLKNVIIHLGKHFFLCSLNQQQMQNQQKHQENSKIHLFFLNLLSQNLQQCTIIQPLKKNNKIYQNHKVPRTLEEPLCNSLFHGNSGWNATDHDTTTHPQKTTDWFGIKEGRFPFGMLLRNSLGS